MGGVSLETDPADRSYLTDEHGQATLKGIPAGTWEIRALKDREIGLATIHVPAAGSDQEEHYRKRVLRDVYATIHLERYRWIEVDVVNHAGQPQPHVIVVINDPDSTDPPPSFTSETHLGDVVHSITDTDGKALFATLESFPDGLGFAPRLQAQALVFGAENPTTIARQGDPRTKIRVQMPETILLDFKPPSGQRGSVLWQEGTRSPSGHSTHISWASGATLGGAFDMLLRRWSADIPVGGRKLRAFAPNGQITFVTRAREHLEAVQTLTLSPKLNQTFRLEPGPKRTFSYLKLQLVDERNKPRTKKGLRIEIANAEGRRQYVHLRSPKDDESKSTGLYEARVSPGSSGTLEIRENNRRSSRIIEPLTTARIEPLAPGEVRDLGRIQVTRGKLLVAGRAVGSDGRGISGVQLSVQAHAKRRAGIEKFYRLRSGIDGYFELYGLPVPGRTYTIEATDKYRSKEYSFDRPLEDLNLEAFRSSCIEGRIRPALPVLKTRIELELYRNGERDYSSIPIQPDGRFQTDELVPGNYKIAILVAGLLVDVVENIQVEEDKVSRPEKLKDLKAGEDLHFVQVEVLDPDGNPLLGAQITAVPAEGAQSLSMSFDRQVTTNFDGIAQLVIQREIPFKVLIEGPRRDFMNDEPELQKQIIDNAVFPLRVQLEY